MKQSTRESAKVEWVISFVAFCATSTFDEAGTELGVAPKTIRDHVRALELWLHRVLMDETDRIPVPTADAHAFVPSAVKILQLLGEDDLQSKLKYARVAPDGFFMVEGKRYPSSAGGKIGNIMLAARADRRTSTPYVRPPRVDPTSITFE